MRPAYGLMIESVEVIEITVRMHYPKAYESIPSLEHLLYPIITYSMPGKSPRKFTYSSAGRATDINQVKADIKTYSIGRSTIALSYREEMVLSRVASSVTAKSVKKVRSSLTRKDFNRSFQSYAHARKKLTFATHLRSVLEEHIEVASLRDITKIFTEVKNHKTVQSVMET